MTVEAYTREEVAAMCRTYFTEHFGTVSNAAKTLGVSSAYVSAIGIGKKPPPKWLRKNLGIERVSLFMPATQQGDKG